MLSIEHNFERARGGDIRIVQVAETVQLQLTGPRPPINVNVGQFFVDQLHHPHHLQRYTVHQVLSIPTIAVGLPILLVVTANE